MVFQNKLVKILPTAAIATIFAFAAELSHASEHDPHEERRRLPRLNRHKDYREPEDHRHDNISLTYNPPQNTPPLE